MVFKELEIQGFKSFPDKVKITFDEGVTGVVGPNGSGKSTLAAVLAGNEKFTVTEGGLLPPFISVHGLGEAAALDTVEKRRGKEFISVEEFSMCCNKLSKTHIEQLRALGAFAGMADTSQLTLFG